MPITLSNIGKRYNREWIFRGVDATFDELEPTVILGSNGSGKSTLLQVISGAYLHSEGSVAYTLRGQTVDAEKVYRHISIATPYLELMEEFTLAETVHFHARFKQWRDGLKEKDVIAASGLEHAKDKALKNYSSGMKQRVRLLLALLSDTSILLLDEPCSNLDANATRWYQELAEQHRQGRITIVCSNRQEQEYPFCKRELLVENFKAAVK